MGYEEGLSAVACLSYALGTARDRVESFSAPRLQSLKNIQSQGSPFKEERTFRGQ
jgi:hypothetical protein